MAKSIRSKPCRRALVTSARVFLGSEWGCRLRPGGVAACGVRPMEFIAQPLSKESSREYGGHRGPPSRILTRWPRSLNPESDRPLGLHCYGAGAKDRTSSLLHQLGIPRAAQSIRCSERSPRKGVTGMGPFVWVWVWVEGCGFVGATGQSV